MGSDDWRTVLKAIWCLLQSLGQIAGGDVKRLFLHHFALDSEKNYPVHNQLRYTCIKVHMYMRSKPVHFPE
jgi:hypothetical protein